MERARCFQAARNNLGSGEKVYVTIVDYLEFWYLQEHGVLSRIKENLEISSFIVPVLDITTPCVIIGRIVRF